MSQADFGIIGDLFAVIKSAAEHGTKFPQIVAAAHSKLAEIENNLGAAAAEVTKRVDADAAAKAAVVAKQQADQAKAANAAQGSVRQYDIPPSSRPYVPGESEAIADSTTDQQPSLLDRRI